VSDFPDPDDLLAHTSHRPWPVPDTPWLLTQSWHDLLFAHWPLDPDALRSKVPANLPLDVFDGRAWIGVIPFHMTNVGPRGMPSLPGLSAFPELNVRTYVTLNGKPGVYFFSLDAASTLAVIWRRGISSTGSTAPSLRRHLIQRRDELLVLPCALWTRCSTLAP
jgi:uncharacterized protein